MDHALVVEKTVFYADDYRIVIELIMHGEVNHWEKNKVPRVEVITVKFSDLKSIELYHCWIKESNLKLHTIWKYLTVPIKSCGI